MIRKILERVLPRVQPPICADVGAWARQRGLPVQEIHAAVRPEVEAFFQLDPVAADCFRRHMAEFERPQELVCLKKARVRGQEALVSLSDGAFCQQGIWDRQLLTGHYDYQRPVGYPSRAMPGDWFSLISLWSYGYYHWFSDVLPRLHTALPHLPPGTRFLINENPGKYQLESLLCYGIGPDRLLEQPFGVDSRPERLWFATPLGHTSGTSTEVLRAMREKIYAGLGLDLARSGPPTRLWISRNRARVRRLVNEEELLPLLGAHGIQVCHLEEHAWREQIRLVREADWLLGPHGAGLTNYLFAPNARVAGQVYVTTIEGFSYMIKARQSGLHYLGLEAVPTPTETDPQAMSIAPAKFAAWLDELELLGKQ